MQPLTESLINSSRKASHLLQRDFFELEILQNSRGTESFTNKSFSRTKSILLDELQRHNCPIFSLDEKFDLPTDNETVILIDPLEGILNFSKSLPFFAVAIYYLKLTDNGLEIKNIIINFPCLREIYYMEKGAGMWGEKNSFNLTNKMTRLRGSNFDQLANSVIGTNDFTNLKTNELNIRTSGSFYYNLTLFAAGKLDILHMKNLSPIHKLALTLITTEVGNVSENFLSDGIIAGNTVLLQKFKQL